MEELGQENRPPLMAAQDIQESNDAEAGQDNEAPQPSTLPRATPQRPEWESHATPMNSLLPGQDAHLSDGDGTSMAQVPPILEAQEDGEDGRETPTVEEFRAAESRILGSPSL